QTLASAMTLTLSRELQRKIAPVLLGLPLQPSRIAHGVGHYEAALDEGDYHLRKRARRNRLARCSRGNQRRKLGLVELHPGFEARANIGVHLFVELARLVSVGGE